jgi:hypothetical protein
MGEASDAGDPENLRPIEQRDVFEQVADIDPWSER